MEIGKHLIFLGVLILLIGLLIQFFDLSSLFSKNILDFKYESKNIKFFFPLGSMILLSIFLSVILNIINK